MVIIFKCENPKCGKRTVVLGFVHPKVKYCDLCVAAMIDRKVTFEHDKLMEARLHKSQTHLG